mgnify:CR=1 FL=1
MPVAAYFRGIHLDGFAHWMTVQAHEELGHAMKLFVDEALAHTDAVTIRRF